MIHKRYLVLDSNGEGRVVTRWPQKLKTNEVAFRLNVKVPEGWARIADQDITVELPPPPAAVDISLRVNN